MTQTAGMAPKTSPDGSGKREAKTQGKTLVGDEIPKIAEVACRFAKARQRKALVYILGAGDPTQNRPDIPITNRTAEQVERALGAERFDDLDLVIQSSGGDIHAAYLIMSMLRERMKGEGELVACVPSRAQSAATLLCLGTDQILFGELGSLGPLDAQIRRGTTDAGTPNYVSALHLLKTLTRLQQFSLESFTSMADHLDLHQASHEEQIKYGIKYSRAITCPLFEHIDAGEVGRWDQMLRTGEDYGRRLLKRGHLIQDGRIKDRGKHIISVVHELVYGYPSHELVIDRDVLEHLKLRSGLIPGDNGALQISRDFDECSSETLIMLVDPFAFPDGPPPAESSETFALSEWKCIGRNKLERDIDELGRDPDEQICDRDRPATPDIAWSHGDDTFAMRVALYRSAVKRYKRWGEPEVTDGGPATQYSRVSQD